MKIYHVETQEDYYELMIELEEKGCKWRSGEKLTDFDEFNMHGIDTYVYDECGVISVSSGYYFKEHHSDMSVIEYKTKGENMTQEEMKQKLQENAFDVSIAIGMFARCTLTAEKDLQEAKSAAKKLIEKIDEYLEYLKPKFNVGDYVIEQNGNIISKIGEVLNGDFWGSYYKKTPNCFSNLGGNILVKDIERHATQEEIAEYEAALTFHKNGREPFEVKRGDIVYLKGYDKNIFLDSGNIYKKHNFVDGDVVLIKTAEEVNEWLENK